MAMRRPDACVPVRHDHYAAVAVRQLRVLKIVSGIAALVSGGFGIWQLLSGYGPVWMAITNLATAMVFLAIPMLRMFGELVAPLLFIAVAYGSVSFITWQVGTGSGLQSYLLIGASVAVLLLGVERIALAGSLALAGAVLVIVLDRVVPRNTGVQSERFLQVGFTISVLTAALMGFATVWYAMREIARAETAMEQEYQRSETLLANIIPAGIAARLKDPSRDAPIADHFDDASILFADIAGYTERASETDPGDLVAFLDRLYTEFDLLVERHGLEKIKTTGDAYMVVAGVPKPRPDHVQALAALALDLAEAVAQLRDPAGREVPIRIGMASGPVVAGVVGSRRFFYDVWGDAVNVASRMESTDQPGRIQVPHTVYQRLRDDFEFEERGEVEVKGKGLMHTWFLTGRRTPGRAPTPADRQQVDVAGT